MPTALFRVEDCHLLDQASHINFERFISGEERGRYANDETFITGPGEIEFFNTEGTSESIASARQVHSLTIPRSLLGFSPDEPICQLNISASSTIGELVFAEWDAIFVTLHRESPALPVRQLDRLAACIKIAMGVHPQREDVRAHARDALFRQICRFIEDHLENPNLSTNTLLDHFGVSRATLYRMSEPLGGVRNYVTERRAASALFFISNGEGRRGFVQAACERWRFSSPANFNRTIQRLFGNSPKALLFAADAIAPSSFSPTDFIQNYIAVRHNGDGHALPMAA